jgi:S-adenosylmethionine hydrolase
VEVRRIENAALMRAPVSATFHGRDIFAPAAGYLSRGMPIDNFGPVAAEWVRLSWPGFAMIGGRAEGEIVYIDRFGNAVTSIDSSVLDGKRRCSVRYGAAGAAPIRACYAEAGKGEALAIAGSSGLIEISVNGGHACSALGLAVGSKVAVVPHDR